MEIRRINNGKIFYFGNEVIPKYSFNAKELDEETGMYYFEARYYRAPTFISRDPLFEKYPSISPYAYCFNNPVKFVDPTGMEGEVTELVLADQSRGTNHTQTLVNSLSKISGMDITTETRDGRTFLNYAKDANGNPIVKTDADGNSIGSETARGMLQNLIDNPEVVNVSRVGNSLESHAVDGKNQINLNFEQILGFMNGVQGGLNPETLGYGMTFLHEFTHTPLGGNLSDAPYNPGQTVKEINKIRAELNKQGGNYGQRMDYISTTIMGQNYLPFDSDSFKNIRRYKLPPEGSKYIKF